jgi:Tol biopolymer transport system component
MVGSVKRGRPQMPFGHLRIAARGVHMRSRSLVVSMAIGAIALAVASAPAGAAFPGTNGRVAFVSNPTGDRDILTMNPDGSGIVNVTGDPGAPGFALEPDYSPDGTKIAFRAGRENAAEIYTVNADGTGLTQLTFNSVKDYSPAWSPDGSIVTFASNRNDPNCVNLFGCNIDIFVMPATGGSPVQVTFDSGSDQFPEFSPDGELIAYDTDVGGAYGIYTVDFHTLAVTKLTADSLRAGLPDWSPDGTKITFSTNWYPCKKPKVCKGDIHVMNADGGGVTQLTHKFGDNLWPAWSPEGDKIVFGHNNLQLKPQQIYEINPDGTGLTRTTHTNDDSFQPDWGSG